MHIADARHVGRIEGIDMEASCTLTCTVTAPAPLPPAPPPPINPMEQLFLDSSWMVDDNNGVLTTFRRYVWYNDFGQIILLRDTDETMLNQYDAIGIVSPLDGVSGGGGGDCTCNWESLGW